MTALVPRWITFSPDRGVWVVVDERCRVVRVATPDDICTLEHWEDR